ncbi:hypothetical protein EXIGLDRAFT_273205 [Exidia glandulosa HHB12029]|uniref:Zn(2)-C6 fungal-type domain-containing protein n=1 Tax=Exidia glandulosa HHB12029 TaxID=1314781 RepID=A0A165DL43_EXIGL|nr:hypothetical protein EXIGLDRAFT_273205 [Exidia glandulosa HHB12029]
MPRTHEATVNKACQPCRMAKVACKRGSGDGVCQRCEHQHIECVQVKRKDRVVTATLGHLQQENKDLKQEVARLREHIEALQTSLHSVSSTPSSSSVSPVFSNPQLNSIPMDNSQGRPILSSRYAGQTSLAAGSLNLLVRAASYDTWPAVVTQAAQLFRQWTPTGR